MDAAQRIIPVAAGGRIFWTEQTSEGSIVRDCDPIGNGQGCRHDVLDLEPATRRFFRSEGNSLVWVEREGLLDRIFNCAIRYSRADCTLRSIVTPNPVVSLPTSSGHFYAWQSAWQSSSGGGNLMLSICKRDPRTADCPTLPVYSSTRGIEPQLSGNRLVWSDFVDERNSDIYFCEYDSLLGECPIQRLTAELSVQQRPRIDRHVVVWEDERTGSSQISGIRLPRLAPVRNRVGRIGTPMRIRVRAVGPDSDMLELAASVLEAPSLKSLGARFVDLGRGRGELRWTPGSDQVGVFTFTFSATRRPGGLATRRTMQVDVSNYPREASRGSTWR